jgi:hypothetical protein
MPGTLPASRRETPMHTRAKLTVVLAAMVIGLSAGTARPIEALPVPAAEAHHPEHSCGTACVVHATYYRAFWDSVDSSGNPIPLSGYKQCAASRNYFINTVILPRHYSYQIWLNCPRWNCSSIYNGCQWPVQIHYWKYCSNCSGSW